MATNQSWAKYDEAAHEEEQLDIDKLGAAANDVAFLENPDDGIHYNVFLDVWKWVCGYLKRDHGNTHQ
ncbi:MAG: hypothetical protein ACLQMO_08945 [Acidobacteriaceae bacterium]